ncbi:potassium channel family protein [Pseudodonghicola flavimaris]|uniref:Potassium channel family protein n=1 Tax=Pseudodonghicola flavimaris TaxID=3050036 RepID=A0ABT7F1F8_9RHOB|nr:potassium channel family protein [Pseudodonghicola flavimaris]MDK3018444.1 potassium channel family protein [Pseudodonghicola flavimaris]
MNFKPLTVIYSVVFILTLGTLFFRYVEGWSWIDSYFFTVVTISTVGYGNLVPVTLLGKLGTTFLIFFGLGVFAVAIQQFALYNMRKREEETEWLIARLGHRHDEEIEEGPIANEDDRPREQRPHHAPAE